MPDELAKGLPLKIDMESFRSALAELGRTMSSEAERIGVDLGKAMSKGLGGGARGGGAGGAPSQGGSATIAALGQIAPAFRDAGGAAGDLAGVAIGAAKGFASGGPAGALAAVASDAVSAVASESGEKKRAFKSGYLRAPTGASEETAQAYGKFEERQASLQRWDWLDSALDAGRDTLGVSVYSLFGKASEKQRMQMSRSERAKFEETEGVAASARDRVASKYERFARAGVAGKISDEKLQEEIAREERRDRGALESRRRIQAIKTSQAGEDPRQHHIGT